ncbi:MAG TPA: LCP family protein [Phycicoccus sp.]|nr:LCP family protein [Phycicoccus sp.]
MSRWDDEPATPTSRRGVHRGQHRHPWLRAAAWVAASLVVLIVGGTALALWRLNSNVSRVDVSKAIGTDRPTPSISPDAPSKPLNILALGSDSREELSTEEYGSKSKIQGARSDTAILIHISADRKSVLAVSIPRDTMLPAPRGCSASTPRTQWVIQQWNSAFEIGGVGCSIRTLEGNTGVFIDHYAVVNFEGFSAMVDALGGVEVCTPVAVNDPLSELVLPAGRSTLNGHDALGYVRARKTLSDGSDLGRIKRQQAFMASVAQKAVSTEMLRRPDKVYGFLSAATKSLTTDPQFGVSEMADVAKSLQNVGAQHIQFVTVPVEDYPKDRNRVQWTDNADIVWNAIKADSPLGTPGSTPSPSSSSSGTASPSAEPLTVSPARISVRVLNGSGIKGIAGQAAEALRVQGFASVTAGDAPRALGVLVEYSPYQEDAARTVAAAFPGATLRVNSSLHDLVQVTLGTGAPTVVEVPNRLGTTPLPSPSITGTSPPEKPGSASPSPEIPTRTADQNICQE